MKFSIPKRYRLLFSFVLIYLVISFLVRMVFYCWSFDNIDFSIIGLLRIVFTGLFFDVGTISFFAFPYALYLFVIPNKLHGKLLDRIITYFALFVGFTIFVFSFFAEFTFWEEFSCRFNFIAVDYLIYTHEVVQNINESYPIPVLLSAVILIVLLFIYLIRKKGILKKTFEATCSLKQRLTVLVIVSVVPLCFILFITNKNAEWSLNRYENELSKSGIYSFFAAFRNNELEYTQFYITQDLNTSAKLFKQKIVANNDSLLSNNPLSILRMVKNDSAEITPNVIFICIESFSAEFMTRFGSTNNITPFIDTLVKQSILFTNLYATGTRTIRGMEAITLSIPPSPGRSIVKRKNNGGLFNIGSVFQQKGYQSVFFYGGDGYFDNMNQFFGGNGFDIVDRGRGYLMGDDFTSKRTNINDDEVTFENAWGVCDEDIYRKVIKEADLHYQSQQPFFNFIMTTSNHRPYTYPEGKIDIPSGSNRYGAVKYTDYAIGEFLQQAQTKPWFSNTVFVIMADHCASSAGKQELDVDKYHIPAIIYNLPGNPSKEIDQLCSQIDLFPTLFGYLNWTYTSKLMGQDVNRTDSSDERTFIANYRKLGLLKKDKLMVLGEQKNSNFYEWNQETDELILLDADPEFLKETVAYFQMNDHFYKNGLLKVNHP